MLLKSVNASLRAKQFYNKNQAKLKMKSIFIKMEGKTTVLFLKLKNESMLKKKKKELCFRVFTGSNGLKTCLYILYLSASQIMAEERRTREFGSQVDLQSHPSQRTENKLVKTEKMLDIKQAKLASKTNLYDHPKEI